MGVETHLHSLSGLKHQFSETDMETVSNALFRGDCSAEPLGVRGGLVELRDPGLREAGAASARGRTATCE